MVIVWDEAKRQIDIRTHRMDFADVRDRFEWNTALIVPSYPGPDGRERFVAVGHIDDRLVALVFSPLGTEAISAISLRPASRKERMLYAEA